MSKKYGKNNESVEVKGIGVGFGEVDSTGTAHTATFIISKEVLDDDNEVLLIDGMDISAIKSGKRNVVWLDHMHTKEAALIDDINKTGKDVISNITFPARPEDLPFTESWVPDLAFAKSKVGFLKASIDFISTERRLPTKKDKEMFGDVDLIHSKSKLIGFSLTSMPANEDAQMVAIKSLDSGKINEEEFNLLGLEYKEIKDKESVEEVVETVEEPVIDPELVKIVEDANEKIEVEEVEEVVEVDDSEQKKEEVEKILQEIKQKREKKPYYIIQKVDSELAKKQLATEMAKKIARITGKIFVD